VGSPRSELCWHLPSPANAQPHVRAGPGTLAIEILDALANLDRETLLTRARRELMRLDLRLYALIDPEHAGGRGRGGNWRGLQPKGGRRRSSFATKGALPQHGRARAPYQNGARVTRGAVSDKRSRRLSRSFAGLTVCTSGRTT